MLGSLIVHTCTSGTCRWNARNLAGERSSIPPARWGICTAEAPSSARCSIRPDRSDMARTAAAIPELETPRAAAGSKPAVRRRRRAENEVMRTRECASARRTASPTAATASADFTSMLNRAVGKASRASSRGRSAAPGADPAELSRASTAMGEAAMRRSLPSNPSRVPSCQRTARPSHDARASVSMCVAPTAMAARNASLVFSVARSASPR